jgi:chromosomal replication initiation ATPase DnaA
MSSGNASQSLVQALLDKQIISSAQLSDAQRYMQEHSVGFEQALVGLEILSEDDLTVIYDDLFHLRSLKLEDVEIDHDAVRHVPAAVAYRHHLIPVRCSGNTLAVAMADPTDANALSALAAVTDFEIVPFVARYDAIEHALYLHYGEPVATATESAERSERFARPRALLEDDRSIHLGKSVQVDRRCTFDRFVSDAASEFPLTVALSIARQEAEDSHNPFHCWGTAGSGKTHLLHAIANHLTTHAPLKRFVLTTGERFLEDLYQSIRDRKINFFRYLYRELDLLLIDDADPLLGREWAQRELLETFRHLRLKGRQMVISASHNLADEPRIQSELRGELESGVIAGFGHYSETAKLEIARRCVGAVNLTPEALARVVTMSGENITELMSYLQHLTVMAALGEEEITADLAEDLIQLCGATRQEPALERARAAAPAKPAAARA